ncbi:PIG-L family deacetylase [Streptomyces griseoaurantiacus]
MRFRHARAAWADRAKRHTKDSTDSGTGGSGTGTPGTGRSGTARRAVLVGGAVGLGGAVVGYGLTRTGDASAKAPTAGPAPVSGRPAVQGRRALLMQVLAHPDDDLYFMNPDTQYALAAGTPLVCVYVTAGEADGVNKTPGLPPPPADKNAYSSARHQGLRQSYASQLGLPIFTRWNESSLALPGGHRAELNTLEHEGRRIELIHLDLAMHTPFRQMGVPALWRQTGLRLATVVPDGSPVQRVRSYDHEDLLDVLVGLFEHYRPTLVHTLDPDPDIQVSDRLARIRDSEQPGYSDHADHTAVASFTWAALARWARTSGPDGPPEFSTVAYRAYYNRHWPDNLPRAVLTPKAAHLVPYGGSPEWNCGNEAGCGDYNVGGDRPLRNRKRWVRSTHYRHPGPRLALTETADGRLTAYGVLGMRAVRWQEGADGTFGEPSDLGGGPLAPTLGSAVLDDGRLLLLGLRFASVQGLGGADTREIVLLEQRAPGGAFKAWTGLGNPEGVDADRGRRIGVPVAVTAPDGRVHLFVRNADQGISTRVRETGGVWSPWRNLGGGQVQDGLTAVVGADGEVHVYAPGREDVHHWTPEGPSPVPGMKSGPRVPADAIAVADGHLYFRPPASPALLAPAGGAVSFPGYGPVVAAGAHLLGRALDGRLRLVHGTTGRHTTSTTDSLDGFVLHGSPRRGPVAAGLTPEGRPWLWRPDPSPEASGTPGTPARKV